MSIKRVDDGHDDDDDDDDMVGVRKRLYLRYMTVLKLL